MNIVKKIVRKGFNLLGYDVVLIEKELQNRNYGILSENFKNLCKNYEFFFGREYGTITENSDRVELLTYQRGTPPSEAYFIISAIQKTQEVKGDICEFGVAQGATSALIANEIAGNDKILHLFDSFEGLPAPTEKDTLKDDIFNLGSMEAYAGQMSCAEELVKDKLKSVSFPENRVAIHKGFIEKLIIEKKNFPSKVSFAFVDFDFYEPLKISLNYLNEITDKGAIIIVDDYDFFSTGAKTGVDEFLMENPNKYDLFVPDKRFGCFAILTKK
ncbi:TylF/MycF/NovP-related O-methyltransferase [uncultured Draconibacterium sp.]|uniref:TylF/MycF/NovP-related O-methyltransferase n=1 Tax=uncultured Draconibacterium sp. TaxID=1573823 RepID=UPI00321745E0